MSNPFEGSWNPLDNNANVMANPLTRTVKDLQKAFKGPGDKAPTEADLARKSMIASAGDLYKQSQANLATGGSTVATPVGPSAQTLAGQKTMSDWATGTGADYSNMLGTATHYGLNGAMDVQNNPYLRGAMDAAIAPITSKYNDPGGVLANIRSDSVQSGQYGGTRQGLEAGIAGGRYLQTIGDVTSKMGSDAYNKGQDTFAKTLNMTPDNMQASQKPGLVQSAVGAQQEAYQQEQNQFTADTNNWEQNKGWVPLQNYSNIVNGVSPVTPQQPQASKGSKVIGGAAAGFSVGGVWGGVAGAVLGLLS